MYLVKLANSSMLRHPVTMKSKLLLATILLLGTTHFLNAAVINAPSGSFGDVSAAVAHANPGDTVVIPPGTNAWTSTMVISGITLQGAGVNNTVIRDETPIPGNGAGTAVLQMNTVLNALTRVTQIQFAAGITNNITTNPNNYDPDIVVYGGSPNWRIDHSEFNLLTGKSIQVNNDSFGLIDHNIFLTSDRISVEVYGLGWGDPDWAAPTQFGSANAVYIEDNYQSDNWNFGIVDISGGGRCVFRHNTLVGSYFNTHGSETSQRYRSDRYVEVYNNTFTYGNGQQYNDFFTACDIRGGSAVIFSNTAVGFYSLAAIEYYRATDNDTGFTPWFGATGISGWDNNGPVLLTGTASVTSNALVVAGANWTANQWVGCTVYNANSQLCGMVSGNNANTMTFAGSRRTWLQINFNQGDSFQVHHIYPMLDQPGAGQCDLLSGDNPTPVWLHQQAEPIYVWSNSLSIMYNLPTPEPAVAGTVYPDLVQGRDFFNNTPRPGYTPYTYPHPLTLSDSNNVAVTIPTNSVSTNVVQLAPPTNLSAHGL
jgi:hypothetical protein